MVLTYLSRGVCRACLGGRPASCGSLGRLCFGGARHDRTHALYSSAGEPVHDRFFGQSSFAGYALAHERNVVPVRMDAPLELLGPLGCGVMTGAGAVWNELEVKPGSSFAVFGAGAVGLSAVMAAQVAGAQTIIAIDRIATRLDLARELGATHAIDVGSMDTVETIRAITGGGVEFALDTTGRNAVISTSVLALRQRGVTALVAVADPGPQSARRFD